MTMADQYSDGPVRRISTLECRILKLLFNAHHIICLALLVYTFDAVIGIALACYGLTIGFVVVAMRLSQERNLYYESF